ncbi:MAG: 2Fe-2S iron-sulfur cluster-binding protein, partial [Planctomycetota bacterium]
MTNTYRIHFLPHNKEISAAEGQPLIRAAMEAGVHVNASCGGEGVCGKCRVIIEAGSVEGGVTEKLSANEQKKGFRLACQSLITSDLTVRIPIESEVDASVLNMQATPRRTARIQEMDLEELKEKGLFVPPVEKKFLELPEPNAQDNLADVTRLVSYLKLKHDEHHLDVDLSVIRKIPDILRQDGFKITATLARSVHEEGKNRIINVQPGNATDRNFAIAMDIGTTTIYGQVIDLISGKVLSQYGEFNGQISYGEDVISRIVFAEKPGGLNKLQEVVIKTINKVIEKIIKRAKIDPDEISTITLAGNTTMTQLML